MSWLERRRAYFGKFWSSSALEDRIQSHLADSLEAYDQLFQDTFHELEQQIKQDEQQYLNLKQWAARYSKAFSDKTLYYDNEFNNVKSWMADADAQIGEEAIEKVVRECVDKIYYQLAEEITKNVLKQVPVTLGRDDIVGLIVEEVKKNLAANPVDTNAVTQSVLMELNPYVQSNVSLEISKALDDIHRYYAEGDSEYSSKYAELKRELDAAKRENDNLLSIVRQQDVSIRKLNETVKQIQEKLIGKELSISKETREYQNADKEEEQKPILPLFAEEPDNYNRIIDNFCAEAKKLRDKVGNMLSGDAQQETYLKLIDKCLKKFDSLKGKIAERQYDSGKIANDTAKILRQTVIKALSQASVKSLVEEYLKKCGVRKLPWKVGRKLTDEDYEYLEEPILYDRVAVPSLHGTITSIIQDTYVVDYAEDKENCEAVIPGIYHIGKYSNI